MSNSLDARVCITEEYFPSLDSQESLQTSQSQESEKENIENSSSQDSLSRKNSNSPTNKNKLLTDILELVEQQHNCYGQKWHEFGIRKAISVIKNHPKKIKSGNIIFLQIFT